MARPRKGWGAEAGFLPLREYWREINRHERDVQAKLRADRKRRDKKRRKCCCGAYKFPHRPSGGLCRWPDPPEVSWRDEQRAEIAARVTKFRERFGEASPEQMADLIALSTKPHRPYRGRYAGILRQIARNNGLHPIRDRALLQSIMLHVVTEAKSVKRRAPRAKYRNMEIVKADDGRTVVQGVWTSAGPQM